LLSSFQRRTKITHEIEDVFRVHVLGVGNYYSERYSTVSFVVQAGKRLILIEAPAELRRKLAQYRSIYSSMIPDLRLENINDIIVTHDHGDHSAGLEMIADYKMFEHKPTIENGGERPRLYGPEEVIDSFRKSLNHKFTYKTYQLDDYFDIIPTIHHSELALGQDLSLTTCKADHEAVPAFGLVLNYQGTKFGYSGDTKFSPRLLSFLSPADLLIHECDGGNVIHTTPAELATWRKETNYRGELKVCHIRDNDKSAEYGLTPLVDNIFVDVERIRER
jgi:ribonuclease BN (tRNA processing enzyme)